jgi:hypothetical protein
MSNKGGRDGAGLCVFTSIGMSADWQSVESLIAFRDWMTKHPGGGYPSKVDDMIARMCADTQRPIPAYAQMEAADLDMLELACKSGRMPAVTYCWSPTGRYGGGRISHMVSLVHADGDVWGILDNNHIGSIEWMNRKEFTTTFTGNGGGWAVFLLADGPPPVPRHSAGPQAVTDSDLPEQSPAQRIATDFAEVRTLIRGGVEAYQRGDAYSINGKAATRADLVAAFSRDAAKPWLTVVGGDVPQVEGFRARKYAADAWQLRPFKLASDPRFAAARYVALIQDAAGVVRHAQYTADAQQLRDADPNYDPAKNPDASKRGVESIKVMLAAVWAEVKARAEKAPVWVWFAAAFIGYVWWNEQQKVVK